MLKEKLKAAAIHFLASSIVCLLILMFVYFGWYEGVLSSVQNVGKILSTVICVDIVLGPFLTFVVYKKEKKSLTFDLGVIALVQMAFLAFGVHTVYISRPAFIVFVQDRFEAIATVDWPSESNLIRTESSTVNLLRPKLVATLMPLDPSERNQIIVSSAGGGPDISQIPKYYLPYSSQTKQVIAQAQSIEALRALNPQKNDLIDRTIARFGNRPSDLGFLPLKGAQDDATVIIDRRTGDVLDMVFLKPWL